VSLGRLRLLFTALSGLVTLIAVFVLGNVADANGVGRINADAERHAEQSITATLVELQAGKEPKDELVWAVPKEGDPHAYADTAIQPPFRLLVGGGDHNTETFSQGGRTYLAYYRAVKDDYGLATVVDLADFQADKDHLRHLIEGLGAGFVLAATAAGWFVSDRALRPARQALVERRGFLADAAHEMRTPLAVIQASASQALSRPREASEYVRSLSEIRAAAERASGGVNELLDLARLESGQAMPRLSPLRLDLLSEEVAASVRVDGCTLTAETGPSVVVDADMGLLRQAVDNVVRNACRRAANVKLVTSVVGRDGVLEVIDDGPGFDAAQLPHVFERYRRGDGRGEVGLGLTLVQAILAAHGGEAAAANRDGGGAVVTLRVPLTRAGLGV
jgi:signal transduction histidine kinase